MDIAEVVTNSKQELINNMLKTLITPNVKETKHSTDEDLAYNNFICKANLGKSAVVELPMDYAIKHELFNLIKDKKVFIKNLVKFKVTFTTTKPTNVTYNTNFNAKFVGNEFNYSYLDNHPGIINVDNIKNIPIDYEGLMAVPPTILEYRHINRFNIHRVIYSPKHNGKVLYPRVVISNKVTV